MNQSNFLPKLYLIHKSSFLRNKKWLLIILPTFLVGIYFFNAIWNSSATPNLTKEKSTYSIAPVDISIVLSTINIDYPIAKVNPNNKRYVFLELRENISKFLRITDELSLANKRISELKQWKNDINWEKGLQNYDNQIVQYITKQRPDYIVLSRVLLTHESTIYNIISTTNKSNDQKKQLYRVCEEMFEKLNNQTSKYNPKFIPGKLYFPTEKLLSDNTKDNYIAYIDADKINHKYNKTISISIANKKINSSFDKKINYFIIKKILIQKGGFITLNYKQENLIKNLEWRKEVVKKKNYRYTFDLPSDLAGKYMLRFTHSLSTLLNVRIYTTSSIKKVLNDKQTKNKQVQDINFLNTTIYPSYTDRPTTLIFNIESKTDLPPVQLTILSEMPINKDELLKNIDISMYPIWEPDISLMKIPNLVNFQIGNQKELAGLRLISKISILIFVLLLIFISVSHGEIKKNMTHILYMTTYRVIKLITKMKFLVLAITMLGMFFDIFYLQNNFDIIILLLSITFLCTVISFRIGVGYVYSLSIIFILLSGLFAYTANDLIAEKFATWSFILLFIGILQSYFEFRHKIFTNTIRGVVEEIRKDKYLHYVFVPFDILDSVLTRFFNQIKLGYIYLIHFVFRPQPANVKDYSMLILKLSFVVVLHILSAYFIFQTSVWIYNKNIEYVNQKTWNSLNPTVTKLEPYLVYPGIKVVILGKNFGWKGNDKVLLAKNGEAIVTELWTDNKIIFTVPLHWDPGIVAIWIKKTVIWGGKNIVATSQKNSVKVLPRTGSMSSDDEAYFQQLKKLNTETLKINGYE